MKEISIKSLKYNDNIIDIRDNYSYKLGHVKNAINIPMNELLNNMYLLDKNKTYYIYCQSGIRSLKCTKILNQFGYNVVNVYAGYNNY